MKSFFSRFLNGNSSRVVINGKTYTGNTVSVIDGQVTVDGVKQEGTLPARITIAVYGDVETLDTVDGDVTVSGNVGSVATTSGDVTCGAVQGDVTTTTGDIKCGNIGGSVDTNTGDVDAKAIAGDVSTVTGDISK